MKTPIYKKTNLYIGLFFAFLLIVTFVVLSKLLKKTNDNEIDNTKVKKKNLTFADENAYFRLAERLKRAFEGWGTDDKEVLDVLINNIKTKDDFEMLKLKFSIKKINHWLGTYEGNLTQHLIFELEDNTETKQKVFEHLNQIGVVI